MPPVKLPGLIKEPHGKGFRYRVRAEYDKTKRFTVPPPEHPDFAAAYEAARRGEKPAAVSEIKGSVAWLVDDFLIYQDRLMKSGALDKKTLTQRKGYLRQFRAKYGPKNMKAPRHAIVAWRDDFLDRPGAMKNALASVRVMYDWAVERGHVTENPARGVKALPPGGGATPWTPEDMLAFLKAHPEGSMARLTLLLFAFTACRISDAVILGRQHETFRDGALWLDWQPTKKGSAPVSVPVSAPLERAIRGQTVVGETYLLTAYGRPFQSPEGLRNRLKKWCVEAGIGDLSSHGIRKGMGDLMAEAGVSQHQIMAVMGHTEARTSEVYTRGAKRAVLAADAMRALGTLGL